MICIIVSFYAEKTFDNKAFKVRLDARGWKPSTMTEYVKALLLCQRKLE